MKEFGMVFLLLIVGSGLVFFLKGVWEINSTEDFNASDFLRRNEQRIYWLLGGIVFVGLGLFVDPIGLDSVFQTLPFGIQIASPMVVGAALSGLVFIKPASTKKEE